MHLPLEIVARIINCIDQDPWNDLSNTLELRLVSRTLNHEVLKVLLRSDQLNPRNTEKLLELNGILLPPHAILQHAVRWRKKHAVSDDDTGFLPRRRHSCMMGSRLNHRTSLDDPEPRVLPANLMQRYLVSRMERAHEHPCLLSVLINRSVDLVMGNESDSSPQKRQQIFRSMVANFSVDLLGPRYTKKIISALFDIHLLSDWLPTFDAARLATYPNPEYSLRLFYLLRLIQIDLHVYNRTNPNWNKWEGGEDPWDPIEQIIDILEDIPPGPEYKRLFVIEAWNIVASASPTDEDEDLMAAFHASQAGKKLGELTVADRVWYAAKRGNRGLVSVLVSKQLFLNGVCAEIFGGMVDNACWICEYMRTHAGTTLFVRSVVEDVLKCKDIASMKEILAEVESLEWTKIQ